MNRHVHEFKDHGPTRCSCGSLIFVTYEQADGEPIFGEYSFMSDDISWSDSQGDFDEPVEVLRRCWVLDDETTLTFGPEPIEDEDGVA